MYWYCIFEDHISHTYSSGISRYTRGRYDVIVQRIPPNAPQDWELGPKQTPGEFGAYLWNRAYEITDFRHRYAFAVGKTPEGSQPTPVAAQAQAAGHFRQQIGPWSLCKNYKELQATIRYRYELRSA